MPTYQYACTECDHSFEQVQSFSDDSLTVCAKCQGRLRKIFNAVGVVFKGSGFYRNDSRSENAKAAEAKSAGAESTDSKSDTKTDAAASKDSSSKPADSSGSTSSDSGKSADSSAKPKAEAGAA